MGQQPSVDGPGGDAIRVIGQGSLEQGGRLGRQGGAVALVHAGAGDSLDEPVDADGMAVRRAVDHAVGGQQPQRLGDLYLIDRSVLGQAVQHRARQVVRGVAGQQAQQPHRQLVGGGDALHGDRPGACHRLLSRPLPGADGITGRGGAQQVQVTGEGHAGGLGDVGAGVLECQRQLPQLGGQLRGRVRLPCRGGQQALQQPHRVRRLQHAQAQYGADLLPATIAAGGDEHLAAVQAAQIRLQVADLFDVVEDE